ncbi:uncharacterized protein [Magallana gigas]|uniref:uncharacterized protein n=1 Tax=Magallana gigas TaxID=29159 RepID=UPI003342BAC7
MKQEQLCMLIESCDQSAFGTKVSRDTIIYIDSRQGKDIKTYLQIAPFHFAVVGLERRKVDLLCQLAEISKILTCKKEFSDYSLESLQDRIDTYLLGIRNYFPHLQQKVKTHLSVHVVDDILDHGPMDAYKEDAFEKMHGRIRDQLFNQNSHARSRDTAIAFAEMEVLNHILTGGFFPNGEEWLQASDLVQKTSNSQEVGGFLGMPSSEDTSSSSMKLRKAINRERGSLVWETVDDDTIQMLSSTCISRNIPVNFTGAKRSKFRSVRTKADQLANKGTPVLIYVDDNTEEVGIFQEGWLISTREGARIELAQIQKVKLQNSARIAESQLERVAISEEFLLVPVSDVLSILSLVHDCLSEGCRVKDGYLNVCVEQEMKEVRKKFWKHKRNAVYLLNKFSFANARCKYFD